MPKSLEKRKIGYTIEEHEDIYCTLIRFEAGDCFQAENVRIKVKNDCSAYTHEPKSVEVFTAPVKKDIWMEKL